MQLVRKMLNFNEEDRPKIRDILNWPNICKERKKTSLKSYNKWGYKHFFEICLNKKDAFVIINFCMQYRTYLKLSKCELSVRMSQFLINRRQWFQNVWIFAFTKVEDQLLPTKFVQILLYSLQLVLLVQKAAPLKKRIR